MGDRQRRRDRPLHRRDRVFSGTCAFGIPAPRLAPGTCSCVRAKSGLPSQSPGPPSSTTRYWLACEKIVEICRCPKLSYSTSWIACMVTPNRIAASPVDVDERAGSPRSCCVADVTSRRIRQRRPASAPPGFGAHWPQLLGHRCPPACTGYCVRLTRVPIWMSCTGCMNALSPDDLSASSRGAAGWRSPAADRRRVAGCAAATRWSAARCSASR